MLVVVAYDVNLEDADGKRRLRKIAKECVNHGKRVQNSVFECYLDYGQFLVLKNKLEKIMDKNKDSLVFYLLGNNYKNRIQTSGVERRYDPESVLIV